MIKIIYGKSFDEERKEAEKSSKKIAIEDIFEDKNLTITEVKKASSLIKEAVETSKTQEDHEALRSDYL